LAFAAEDRRRYRRQTLNILVLLKPTYFYPTSYREAAVGRNDLGIPSGVATFSGDLKVRLQFAAAGPQ
jgi:hypothetical protein